MSIRRYVVLPAFGYRSQTLAASDKLRMIGTGVRLSTRPALRSATPSGQNGGTATEMQVLDSTHEDGPKLVEMSPDAELNLKAEVPGLRIVPVVTYHTMRAEQAVIRPAADPSRTTKCRVVDAQTKKGVAGAKVIAFTNFRRRAGAEGSTDRSGMAELAIAPGSDLDRLYVYGPARYWGHYSANRRADHNLIIGIEPVDSSSPSLLLHQLYGQLPPDAGAGIRVAIVDTGIAKSHPSLPNVSGGANLVFDEIQNDAGAVGDSGPATLEGDHGTHVAGIVGARPTGTVKLKGIAPGVELRSYRVFPNDGGGATNYDILSAIDRAVLDGCQIVNLSLGGGGEDEALRAAIIDAQTAGTLVVAAAGNDGRKPVSFPASIETCVAVSAMGRIGSFPDTSAEAADIARPYGNDKMNYLAAFSNVGPQIDFIGPGVGIVSTLPDDTFGVMSGTSMACPAIVGFAAYLLAANPAIQGKSGAERVKLWKNLLAVAARPLGFGRDYEGFGMPSISLTS